MRDRCRPLLTDHLNHPPGSEFYEFYVSQLCRNLVRWSIPHAHPYWTKRSRRLEVVGEQHVRRCLDEGRGVIVLLSHFGPWPFISHEFERRGLRIAPTYPLGWPHEARVEMSDRIQFLREARRVLARNGIVGLMGDVGVVGVGGLGRMVELPFLGVTTPFPLGCTALSVRTSTPIVPVFSLRHSDGRHIIVCTEPIDPRHYEATETEQQQVKMLECYAARLEEMVRAHPHNAYSYLEFAPRFTNTGTRL
ncbi:MAG: Kdo2-lipid lauroyltransferase/acyltransferase [Pyrinomonadaceae bacterium]|nr:Kdo2-lipid lauroyltransferase/acyltransferase [Pyrinomonadaceae bacterium]